MNFIDTDLWHKREPWEITGRATNRPGPLMNLKSMLHLPAFPKYMKGVSEKGVGFIGPRVTFQLCDKIFLMSYWSDAVEGGGGESTVMWQQSHKMAIRVMDSQLGKVAKTIKYIRLFYLFLLNSNRLKRDIVQIVLKVSIRVRFPFFSYSVIYFEKQFWYGKTIRLQQQIIYLFPYSSQQTSGVPPVRPEMGHLLNMRPGCCADGSGFLRLLAVCRLCCPAQSLLPLTAVGLTALPWLLLAVVWNDSRGAWHLVVRSSNNDCSLWIHKIHTFSIKKYLLPFFKMNFSICTSLVSFWI